jgi:hypothetical protein
MGLRDALVPALLDRTTVGDRDVVRAGDGQRKALVTTAHRVCYPRGAAPSGSTVARRGPTARWGAAMRSSCRLAS